MRMIHSAPDGGVGLPELTRRWRWAAIVIVVALAVLVGRLWQLQVVRGDRYYQRTVSNVVHERFLPSIRGRILDRNGVPLADNRPAFNLYVEPKAFKDEVRSRFFGILDLDEAEVAAIDVRLGAAQKAKRSDAVLVMEDVTRERAAAIEQARFELHGIEVRHEPHRFYPQGRLAAHVVGYMNQMTTQESERLASAGYGNDELIGRYGLESSWENYLRGKKGSERFVVNARGERIDGSEADSLIEGDPLVEPVAGHDVVLTLDSKLQKIAEDAVRRFPAAAIAAVEVKTGRLMALVSEPAFDPDVMTGHLTREEEALLLADPRKPFIDKTLRTTYPPGSTYKFVVALAALQDGLVDPKEELFCPGYHVQGRRTFRCTSSHEKVDLAKAVQHSCNVYFWKLAERVGIDRMAEVAEQFGFGVPTGLGLNSDLPGRIPTRAWYEDHTAFKIGYTINAAVGQGDVEVTVVQLAMAYAALANGGTLYVPQIVDRVQSARGDVIARYEPQARRRLDLDSGHLAELRAAMDLVVNELGGTAYDYAHSEIVAFAGKTGTAQARGGRRKDDGAIRDWHPSRDHAWFAGYAPVDDPELALVVLIEHGGPGGKVAGPVARDIFEHWWQEVRAAGVGQGEVP